MKQASKEIGLALLLMSGDLVSAATGMAPTAGEIDAKKAQRLEHARAALEGFDYLRLHSDKAYAESMLAATDAILPLAKGDAVITAAIAGMRGVILAALDRPEESKSEFRRILAVKLADPEPYVMAWATAADLQDADLMLETVESVARNVKAENRTDIIKAMPAEMMWPLIHYFREQRRETERDRLIEALVGMNWAGDADPESRDALRVELLDRRLKEGRRDEAARLAQGVTAPKSFLRLILMRKYEGLLAASSGSPDHIASVIAAHDRQIAAALIADPKDLSKVLSRAQSLRGLGREAEALAMLAPFTRDIAATHAQDNQGMWIINEAAYALLALGRKDEAIELMSELVKIDVATSPDLIGPSINYAEMLRQAGRASESLLHVRRLAPEQDKYASAAGRMWIMAAAACSLADLGRKEEAKARLRTIEARRADNYSATLRTMLCLNELDAAERVVLERLDSDDPDAMVLALQDYNEGGAEQGINAVLYQRLMTLRDRPAVAAALDKVARRLRLPLSRIYYGDI